MLGAMSKWILNMVRRGVRGIAFWYSDDIVTVARNWGILFKSQHTSIRQRAAFHRRRQIAVDPASPPLSISLSWSKIPDFPFCHHPSACS